MKKLKNIIWVRNLMVVSQLLLLGFISQWIYSQYREEKNNLIKELNRQFISSKQEVMDSMIMVNLVDPVLNSGKGFKVQLVVNNVDSPNNSFVKDRTFGTKTLTYPSNDSCSEINTLFPKHDKILTINKIGNSKKDLLVHSVKMIYKEVSSISEDSSKNNELIYLKTDTFLLKKLLAANLNKSGFNFHTKWISKDSKDTVLNSKSDLYFETNLFPKAFGVEIKDYKLYLIKRICPQLLFAFILLLLTGAAFYLAFRSLRDQIRLSNLRNEFIGNISHELKTPVSTVKVAIEALQDFDRKQDPRVVSEYLEMASLEMTRLDILIDKVLNTSRLEENIQLIHPVKTELNQFVQEVLKSLQIRFNHLGAIVAFDSKVENAIVDIDLLHIQGVLLNLIDNSLKYSGMHPTINIDLEEKVNNYELSVSDNGPGIPEEYIKKVFEKFFRIPTNNIHNIKGYGLGLSYSALVMNQHKGTITVKNLVGGGCKFILSILKSKE